MKKRPISPHLSIYKWNISSSISILHRATNIYLYFLTIAAALFFGFGFLNSTKEVCGFLPIITFVKNIFECCIFTKIICYIFIFGSIFATIFNILSGFRYFIWSFCIGFNQKFVTISGYFIILFSIITSIPMGILLSKLFLSL